MPLFTGQVAVTSVSSTKTTDFPLPAVAGAQLALLTGDPKRQGHSVKNVGTTRVTVIYGVDTPDAAPIEIYRYTLGPGDVYLYDRPEIIPYSSITQGAGGTLQIVELF